MSSKKILIIDDDTDLRLALNARLRAAGYDTVFAEDGMGAVATAVREEPDLILLDIGLPGGDGFVVMDRFRKNSKLSAIPVIVLSARDAEEVQTQVLEAGAAAFFQKPADHGDLIADIGRALGSGAA